MTDPLRLVSLGLLVIALSAQAQFARCPEDLERSEQVARLCLSALPKNRTLLLNDAKGEPCICRCANVADLGKEAFERLEEQRDSIYQTNFRNYLRRLPRTIPNEPPKYTVKVNVVDKLHVLITWFGGAPCEIDKKVVDIIQQIIALEIVDFTIDTLRFYLEAEVNEEAFSFIEFSSPDTVSANMVIPRRLLEDEAVGEELITFLILHELGHGVLDSGHCEYDADVWASFVGLPRWVMRNTTTNSVENTIREERIQAEESGRPQPDLIPVRREELTSLTLARQRNNIVTQLREYHISQFTDETYALATPCRYLLNCYPQLNCRLLGISGSYLNFDILQTDRGYPSSCWTRNLSNGANASTLNLDTDPYPKKPCRARAYPMTLHEKACADWPVLCTMVSSGRYDIQLNEELACALRQEYCADDPGSNSTQKGARRSTRAKRKFKKHLSAAIKDLERIQEKQERQD